MYEVCEAMIVNNSVIFVSDLHLFVFRLWQTSAVRLTWTSGTTSHVTAMPWDLNMALTTSMLEDNY